MKYDQRLEAWRDRNAPQVPGTVNGMFMIPLREKASLEFVSGNTNRP